MKQEIYRENTIFKPGISARESGARKRGLLSYLREGGFPCAGVKKYSCHEHLEMNKDKDYTAGSKDKDLKTAADRVELERARGEVYTFFAGAFSQEPSREWVDRLLGPAGMSAILDFCDDREVIEEFRALISEYAQGKWQFEDFQVDFDGLFRVPGDRYVHPYESVYRQQETTSRRPDKSMLMGKEALEVSEIYRKECLAPRDSEAVFPDEFGVELEFMAHLCNRTAAALDKKESKRAADLSREQREFITGHLSRWCFPCLENIAARADTPLYRIFARMLTGFMREEQKTICQE